MSWFHSDLLIIELNNNNEVHLGSCLPFMTHGFSWRHLEINDLIPQTPLLSLVDKHNPLILVASTTISWIFIYIINIYMLFTFFHGLLAHVQQYKILAFISWIFNGGDLALSSMLGIIHYILIAGYFLRILILYLSIVLSSIVLDWKKHVYR